MKPLEIVKIKLDKIHVDPANVRKHNRKNIDAIKASLQEFGQCKPLVVQQSIMKILAGNGTYAAMVDLGWTECEIVVVDMSDIKAAAYGIADNRTSELASWDDENLAVLLSKIQENNEIDTANLGFSDTDIAKLLKDIGQAPSPLSENEGSETTILDDKAISQTGDLWHLGPHRLLCGDPENKKDVTKLLSGKRPALMVADPPYGVNFNASWRSKKNIGKVPNDDRDDWRAVWQIWDVPVLYVWHFHTIVVGNSLIETGYKIINIISWVKQHLVFSRGDYHSKQERCFYAVKKNANHNWQGGRDQVDVWEIANNNPVKPGGSNVAEKTWGHSTQKPLECMARPIRNNSKRGEIIADPFLGSGTTLIAAEKLGRICYGCELAPIYCDMIIQRWEKETGKEATLKGGNAYLQIKEERLSECKEEKS